MKHVFIVNTHAGDGKSSEKLRKSLAEIPDFEYFIFNTRRKEKEGQLVKKIERYFKCAEIMIRGMIKMMEAKQHVFNPTLKIVVCIPSGCTEVELRAVRDSAENAGGREVYMIHEPMAAAVGIGLNVEEPKGEMIVDIGGGTTEIAVISLGGIVCDKSIKIAGDVFTKKIQEALRAQHGVKIGERTAEEIKIRVGSALEDLPDIPPEFIVNGPHQVSAKPMEVPVSHAEVAAWLDEPLTQIENAVVAALENTPPELYSDICRDGIWLTGGGALLRGLAQRLKKNGKRMGEAGEKSYICKKKSR